MNLGDDDAAFVLGRNGTTKVFRLGGTAATFAAARGRPVHGGASRQQELGRWSDGGTAAVL